MVGGLVTVVMLIQALIAAVQQALHSQAHCVVVGGDITQIPATVTTAFPECLEWIYCDSSCS